MNASLAEEALPQMERNALENGDLLSLFIILILSYTLLKSNSLIVCYLHSILKEIESLNYHIMWENE